ncbi:hypothetical protein E0Z10_g7840 [Xylaria hypoxylon]|uniref:Protein kinase domain-containing protein n=1 Tax=Xylaria hypoxylon TaxID=37992 RepID=A0A4Z0YN88_9PEZI|nr:hypothetical protein E0Z10_g7840 [Xylaria hypoxylon]
MSNQLWENPGHGPWGIDDGVMNLMLLAEQRQQREIQERVRETREYFETVPDFKFEDFVGNGAYGITVRVRQRGFGLRRSRRLIVKRPLNDRVAGELSNEILAMSRLSGSAHIANIIAHNDNNPLPPSRRFKRLRRIINRFRRQPPSNLLAGLAGPTLVLEYLENGSLSQLRQRLEYERRVIPNRVLWPIFLCLVRACVAMKYPPYTLPDSKPKLEEVPLTLPDRVPDGILHGDMHAGMYSSAPQEISRSTVQFHQ